MIHILAVLKNTCLGIYLIVPNEGLHHWIQFKAISKGIYGGHLIIIRLKIKNNNNRGWDKNISILTKKTCNYPRNINKRGHYELVHIVQSMFACNDE